MRILVLICNNRASPKAGLYVNDTLVGGTSPDQLSIGQFLLEWAVYNYVAIGYQKLPILMLGVSAGQGKYILPCKTSPQSHSLTPVLHTIAQHRQGYQTGNVLAQWVSAKD